MSKQRSERVQEALRQEISNIIHDEIKDPRIGFLTITKVELTKDLRHAKIYFSILGDAKDNSKALQGLNSAKGYIKNIVAERIKLRFVPEIAFKVDESLHYTQEIYDLLSRIRKESTSPSKSKDSGTAS